MSTIIKASDPHNDAPAVAFNFDDMKASAEVYLTKIRQQAGKILAQATQEAQAIRQRAEIEGRQAAERAALAAIDQRIGQQMESIRPAIQAAIDGILQSRPGWLAHWEKQAIHLATAIAQRIVRRELRTDPQITVSLVREALELASGGAHVRLLMNPADFENLGGEVKQLAADLNRLAPTEIVADPQTTAGGCRVETRFGSIDQQIETQLARIENELA
jgi:flagellar assembly protein FliH